MNNIDSLAIESIFYQGDPRYEDPAKSEIVIRFLECSAITLERRDIKEIPVSPKEVNNMKPPQQYHKLISTKILEEEGYTIIGYEVSFCGYRADILARKNQETIAVECCSCAIGKAIKYLENKGTTLWILSLAEQLGELPLFIIKRGPNWEKHTEEYHQDKIKELRAIKNPLEEYPI